MELLTPRDAGRRLGITTAGVIRLARLGQLLEIRDSGGRRIFAASEVERLVREREQRARRKAVA